jgi:hypothetical protein
MRNVNVEIKCKEVERDTRDNQIFSRGIEKLTFPLIHIGALTNSIAPLKSPRLKCSLRILVLHLRNGGSRTVYTKNFMRLPQSPRAHQEPTKHQDRLEAVNL